MSPRSQHCPRPTFRSKKQFPASSRDARAQAALRCSLANTPLKTAPVIDNCRRRTLSSIACILWQALLPQRTFSRPPKPDRRGAPMTIDTISAQPAGRFLAGRRDGGAHPRDGLVECAGGRLRGWPQKLKNSSQHLPGFVSPDRDFVKWPALHAVLQRRPNLVTGSYQAPILARRIGLRLLEVKFGRSSGRCSRVSMPPAWPTRRKTPC